MLVMTTLSHTSLLWVSLLTKSIFSNYPELILHPITTIDCMATHRFQTLTEETDANLKNNKTYKAMSNSLTYYASASAKLRSTLMYLVMKILRTKYHYIRDLKNNFSVSNA